MICLTTTVTCFSLLKMITFGPYGFSIMQLRAPRFDFQFFAGKDNGVGDNRIAYRQDGSCLVGTLEGCPGLTVTGCPNRSIILTAPKMIQGGFAGNCGNCDGDPNNDMLLKFRVLQPLQAWVGSLGTPPLDTVQHDVWASILKQPWELIKFFPYWIWHFLKFAYHGSFRAYCQNLFPTLLEQQMSSPNSIMFFSCSDNKIMQRCC